MNLLHMLLRTGSASWPNAAVLGGWTQSRVRTVVLAATTPALWQAAPPGSAR